MSWVMKRARPMPMGEAFCDCDQSAAAIES